ncbi:hypothetical protein ACHAWF_014868 [Thalassiosira exigua]
MGNSSSTVTSSLGRLRRALRQSGVGGRGGGMGSARGGCTPGVAGEMHRPSPAPPPSPLARGQSSGGHDVLDSGDESNSRPNNVPSSPSRPLPSRFPRRPRSNPNRYIARPSKLGQSVIDGDLAVLSGDVRICRGGRRRSIVSAAISAPAPSKRKLPAEAKSRSKRTKYDMCGKCLWTPTDEVMAAANITTLTPCPQCREIALQREKQKEKNDILMQHVKGQTSVAKDIQSCEQTVRVSLKPNIEAELGSPSVKRLMKHLPKSVVLKVVKLERDDDADGLHKWLALQIEGAELDKSLDFRRYPNVLEGPTNGECDVLLYMLPLAKNQPEEDRNFMALMNSSYDPQDTITFSEREQDFIGEIGKRPGKASGVFLPTDECISFKNIRKKRTTFYKASSDVGVQMSATYINDEGGVKSCNFGYKAVQSYQLTPVARRESAKAYGEYASILKKDAINYIVTMACLRASGMRLRSSDGKYLGELSRIMKNEPALSVENCLIRWMCMTGEHRYHQALACHSDGEHDHQPYEIYTLFRRHGAARRDGILYLPLNNCCVKIKVNKEIMVCNFTHTPHVPDHSRGTHNFSRVHAPYHLYE